MVLLMNRPMKRSGSSFQQFRKRIPADVLQVADGKRATIFLPPERPGDDAVPVSFTIGVEVRFSLRTRDPSLTRKRHAAATEQVEDLFAAYRAGPPAPQNLAPKRRSALAGEAYRLFTVGLEDDPVLSAEEWRAVAVSQVEDLEWDVVPLGIYTSDSDRAAARDAQRMAALEARYGRLVDAVLAKHSLSADPPSRQNLILDVARVAAHASTKLARNADLDYSPDEFAKRFPDVAELTRERPDTLTAGRSGGPSIATIFEKWREHPEQDGIAQSTVASLLQDP